MLHFNARIWLGLAAFLVMIVPVGSTSAPGTNTAQAIHAGLLADGKELRGTVTDLHLIAFSRDIINH